MPTPEEEKLLLRLMMLIAEKFRETAVLKGGMLLRLFNSPRATQDIDYVFLTKQSRKIIFKEIQDIISRNPDMKIGYTSLNSRGLIVEVNSGENKAQIEISVRDTLNLEPEKVTTLSLSSQFGMLPQVITIMALPEAYANKIAATIERSVMRDLYDISIFQSLTKYDRGTLKNRLDEVRLGKKTKPVKMSFSDAAKKLRAKIDKLSQDDIMAGLSLIVPSELLKGSVYTIKNSINSLCQQLEIEK